MTNLEAANEYLEKNHSTADNDFQNALNIAVLKAFIAGCEYKEDVLKQETEQQNCITKNNVKYFAVVETKTFATGGGKYDTSLLLEFENEPNIKEIKEKLKEHFGSLGYNYIKSITKL